MAALPRVTRFPVDERRFDRGLVFVGAYLRWLRFSFAGLEHVPAEGPALLVGNHAGLRLHDAGAVLHAVRRRHPARRIVRGLAHRGIADVPLAARFQLSWMAGVIGTQEDARRLLEEGWLVLTYPEGGSATARPFRERDTVLPLERWGRGWARLAVETGVPVVPVGCWGVEAAIPTLWRSKILGRRWGLEDDLYPVAAQSPLVGFQPFLTPLLPFPVRCGLAFLPALHAPERPSEPEALTAAVHRQVQQAIARARPRSGRSRPGEHDPAPASPRR